MLEACRDQVLLWFFHGIHSDAVSTTGSHYWGIPCLATHGESVMWWCPVGRVCVRGRGDGESVMWWCPGVSVLFPRLFCFGVNLLVWLQLRLQQVQALLWIHKCEVCITALSMMCCLCVNLVPCWVLLFFYYVYCQSAGFWIWPLKYKCND